MALAVGVGPLLVDWNKYKPQIIEQVKSAAGYDVRIDGDIGLSLLPSPRLKIEALSVAAPRGKESSLLTMKRADVSVNLFPLLSGDISIKTIRLVKPEIKLETLPDGSNSWMSDKLLDEGDAATSASRPALAEASSGSGKSRVALGSLVIEGGSVSYEDRRTGKAQRLEDINLDVTMDGPSGPFDVEGVVSYGGARVEIEGKTEKASGDKKEIPADITLALPEANASASFHGIIAIDPMEVQGKVSAKADNLGSVLTLGGGEPSPTLAKPLVFSGLITASEDGVQAQEVDITFGDAKGKGHVTLANLKEKNPVQLKADIALESVVSLEPPAKDKAAEPSVEERVAKGQQLSASSAAFLPEAVSLPFPVDGTVRISASAVESGGRVYKGVTADLSKNGSSIDVAAKAMEIPGKTTAEGKVSVVFKTSSGSADGGVTYADPTASFSVTGVSEQLPTLLRAFAPDQAANTALEIWKTAQFDLTGTIIPSAFHVADSTLKLDQTALSLKASYAPYGAGGRPDIMLDVTTDAVDLDYIQSRLDGQRKQAVQKEAAAKKNVEAAIKPLRDFSLPVNLTFDVSAQKAILNAQTITGIRIKGKAGGQSVDLDTASAQDYMGGAFSLKGRVANLQDLSGVDMSFYGKTADLKALLTSFEVGTENLPQGISAAEANIVAKGKADDLSFDAKIMALSGVVEASGTMTGLLDKPSFSNLSVGAKHPDFVKAMQIVNPSFAGGPGLARPFDFHASAVKTGNVYDLSGLKAALGPTAISGTVKVDAGGAKPSITGSVDAGSIPLDSFLGADTRGKSAAKSASSGGGSSGGGSDGKWSRSTMETGWMQKFDLDVALSAQSITYGGWNFANPATRIVLKDGHLLVDKLQAGLFGGEAVLSAKVQDPADPKQPLSMAVQSKMSHVGVEPLMYALSGSNRVKASGDVSLDLDVQTTGLSPHALISGLQGKAGVNGQNVVMEGFDLAQIGLAFVDSGKPMDRINSIVSGATVGGETRFDTVAGAYDILQGIVTISSMTMDGPAANIKSVGSVNLPLWTIDTKHTITFKQAKDAGAFDVAIKGPLNSPANTFGKGLFNDVLTRRLQQKAMEKLPDVLGKDLTGKLQGLGILPQQQKQQVPAPDGTVTVPANDPNAATPIQPAAPAAEPAKQEDPAKKALEGVLKGLLH